jgi:hypothetical protein
MSTTIYANGTYSISISTSKNRAILKNGTQKIEFPFCSLATEIPQKYLASLGKAVQNPADYFFVGTLDDETLFDWRY